MHSGSCVAGVPSSSQPVEVVSVGPWETVFAGMARKGLEFGHHYHRRLRTYLHVIRGEARIHLVDVSTSARRTRRIASGEGVHVDPGQAHWIRFTQDSTYLILKSGRSTEVEADTVDYHVECTVTSARKGESPDAGLTYFPL